MFEMIDPNIAEKVKASIEVGQLHTFISGPDQKKFKFEVLEIKDYSFIIGCKTVDNRVQKLELSMLKLLSYRKEVEEMTKMQLPDGAVQKRPGRPPKTAREPETYVPAAEMVENAVQPEQKYSDVPTEDFPVKQAKAHSFTFDNSEPLVQNEPGEDIEEDLNIVLDAGEEASDDFKETLKELLTGAFIAGQKRVSKTQSASVSKAFTCFECLNCNVKENKCDLFNIAPPMQVIANAAVMCPDFVSTDEIPY